MTSFVALGTGGLWCSWGREVEHQVLTSRPASSHPVSNESKQNMVEIEQEQLQVEEKRTGAWPCGPGFAAAAVRLKALLWQVQIIYSTEC